jgi:hypothetical protein
MASKWTAPSAEPEAFMVLHFGLETARKYAQDDIKLAVRDRYKALTARIRDLRKQIAATEQSDSAYDERVAYYATLGATWARLGRAATSLAELLAEFPDAESY